MKKISLLILTYILLSVLTFNITYAQDSISKEAIISYESQINVNLDNSIDVTEKITYTTGSERRRGIYRDISLTSSQGRNMDIKNITVLDEKGYSYEFENSSYSNNIRIKIGNPNITFLGEKVYIIKYKATNAITQFKDFDEIYWNVTGNNWDLPIYESNATITLPSDATLLQSACYYGLKGSTTQCQPAEIYGNNYKFNISSILSPKEGMSVAVGFPKGIVIPYSDSDSTSNFSVKYLHWLIASILPILTLIISIFNWYKKGRDESGTGIIVTQYDVPDNLTPMEVAVIANEKNVNINNISAEIIYLATKGYLKINQIEEHFIGLIKSTDFELIRLKDSTDILNDFDHKLLNSLFNNKPNLTSISLNLIFKGKNPFTESSSTNQTQSIKLSNLEYVFYRDIPTIVNSVLDSLLNKGYYSNLGQIKNGLDIFSFIVISMFFSLFIGTLLGFLFFTNNPLPFILGVFISFIIYHFINRFSSSKTKKGALIKEYILGLKEYLQIAEKDRLKFHNAPEKKPEVFEHLLPYAMVLGVADIWAKEFENIYKTSPSWYSGEYGNSFNTVTFLNSINDFTSSSNQSLLSAPSNKSNNSGSSGRGSSGGGGGGGGGGSW